VNEDHADQVTFTVSHRLGALIIAHGSFFASLVQARAQMALIGSMAATPLAFCRCARLHPRVFSQKKSLAAGWGGANQGTKDLPFPINHLLPSLHHLLPYHILHGTFPLINTTSSVRCAPSFLI
jgi:hypothetical protein